MFSKTVSEQTECKTIIWEKNSFSDIKKNANFFQALNFGKFARLYTSQGVRVFTGDIPHTVATVDYPQWQQWCSRN